MEGIEKYLPIGTIVSLKGGTKKFMITGFCITPENDKNQMWDYSACLYPEGIIYSEQTGLFNHDQIEKIYHLGLINDEEINYKKELKKLCEDFKEIKEQQMKEE